MSIEAMKQVVFKIYKPTPPRGTITNVRDAELPWVYNQDPSSGNVASMWVTPVKATPPQRTEPVCPECKAGVLYECVACSSNNYPPQRTWVGLTDREFEEVTHGMEDLEDCWIAIEQALKEKNNG